MALIRMNKLKIVLTASVATAFMLFASPAHAYELPIPFKTNVGLVKYAYNAVAENWGYVRGTTGQVLTEARVEYLINENPELYNTEEKKELARKWVGHRATDCSGLIKSYLYASEGGRRINAASYPFVSGMSSVWYHNSPECRRGDMSTMPETLGVILYRTDHVAIYVGHGKLIEAKGLKYGVVVSEFVPSEWSMWVMPNCIDYINEGFYSIEGTIYCLHSGLINTGWVSSNDSIYYVGADGTTYMGVRNIDNTNYLFSDTGVCFGVYTDDGLVFNDGYYYYYKAGIKQYGWQELNGKTCFFDSQGRQVRSTAVIVDGQARLFLDDGAVNEAAGQVVCNGYTYACNYNGAPMRGYIGNVFYGENYLPFTGFYDMGGALYYFRDGLTLEPGFTCIDEDWYYIKSNGAVSTGEMIMNGRTYNCGATGAIDLTATRIAEEGGEG